MGPAMALQIGTMKERRKSFEFMGRSDDNRFPGKKQARRRER